VPERGTLDPDQLPAVPHRVRLGVVTGVDHLPDERLVARSTLATQRLGPPVGERVRGAGVNGHLKS
jgi:hypothetical protein